jgi:GNAT superfamily N-acetyltransferase
VIVLAGIKKEYQKAAFDCGIEELNQYLKYYALKNDLMNIGKTFVALVEEIVAGYVTLSGAQISKEALPEAVRQTLPRYPVPVMLIGKIAVDLRFQNKGIGAFLLSQALEKALGISQTMGLYAVVVDAIDENAKGFYLRYGFIPFKESSLRLFLSMREIRESYINKPGL